MVSASRMSRGCFTWMKPASPGGRRCFPSANPRPRDSGRMSTPECHDLLGLHERVSVREEFSVMHWASSEGFWISLDFQLADALAAPSQFAASILWTFVRSETPQGGPWKEEKQDGAYFKTCGGQVPKCRRSAVARPPCAATTGHPLDAFSQSAGAAGSPSMAMGATQSSP